MDPEAPAPGDLAPGYGNPFDEYEELELWLGNDGRLHGEQEYRESLLRARALGFIPPISAVRWTVTVARTDKLREYLG